MWFRRDLRVEDNPALSAAMQSGPTIATFFLTEETWEAHDLSPAKKSLLIRQVNALAEALAKLNVPLITIDCGRFSKAPEQLLRLVKDLSVDAVFFNHEYEYDEQQCTRKVLKTLTREDISSQGFHDQCAIRPGAIKTANGDWYQVFTAFKRNYLTNYQQASRALAKKPRKQKPVEPATNTAAIKSIKLEQKWQNLWPAGEAEAHRRLKLFLNNKVSDYAKWRDFPAVEGTSCLSAYLAVGAISTRQCIDAVWQLGGGDQSENNAGAKSWMDELVWRDFYRHLLFAYPDLCKHKAFKANTDKLPWKKDQKLFKAWTEGRTGYPIVDAAMRQLQDIGWMHNRLRMVTAMFLTKHLFIDWRLGEQYFMRNLVDGDLASNNGGWQWSASTGVDAAPYFRIFNPVRQSQRFDPKGLFLRRYLPQLERLDDRSIHMPSAEQALRCGYPAPIVEHEKATRETKSWFKNLR